MNPVAFPEANSKFGPPPGMTESQVETVDAYIGPVERGSLEGLQLVVVAWQPDAEELEAIKSGKPIYLSVLGGLPPHFLTVDFYSATHPA